jgi:hypothetical protein
MLTLVGEQVECLWDEVLPAQVRELPDDLARLDRVLSDSRFVADRADVGMPMRGSVGGRRSRWRRSCGGRQAVHRVIRGK